MPQQGMTDRSRLRKRPLETDATTNARAAGEIDIAGCAIIAYSSEDPAHPVEHMLDGRGAAKKHSVSYRSVNGSPNKVL